MKMENERLCIEISEHGAEVTRIYDKKKETELLWEGNPTYWKRHSPILFPNVPARATRLQFQKDSE